MNTIPEKEEINKYLTSSEIINFEDKNIKETAMGLSDGVKDEIQLIKTVYEFVRDHISHSLDIGSNIVTCRASDVLKYKHGLCFANSHLLAAFLRLLDVPTGFCYQKLEFEEGFGLHGLNAVYISSIDKWVRIDARGNKNGINAQFSLDNEILAYLPDEKKGEIDFPIIYSDPNEKVIKILKNSENLTEAVKSIISTDWLLYLK